MGRNWNRGRSEEPEVKMVPKRITCPRCKGDGTWHSNATGVRAKTVSGPLVDASRLCPECKGTKRIIIRITDEQAKKELAAIRARKKAETAAKKARAAADVAAEAAKKAEAVAGLNG